MNTQTMMQNEMNVAEVELFEIAFRAMNSYFLSFIEKSLIADTQEDVHWLLRYLENNSECHTLRVKEIIEDELLNILDRDNPEGLQEFSEYLTILIREIADQDMENVHSLYMGVAKKLFHTKISDSKWRYVEIQEMCEDEEAIEKLVVPIVGFLDHDKKEIPIASIVGVYNEEKDSADVSVFYHDTSSITDAYVQMVVAETVHWLAKEIAIRFSHVDVKFISIWNDGFEVETKAKLLLCNGVVYDIESSDIVVDEEGDTLDVLDGQKVELPSGVRLDVEEEDNGTNIKILGYYLYECEHCKRQVESAKPLDARPTCTNAKCLGQEFVLRHSF